MILTKAYIRELPSTDSNMYRVEVPLMEDNTQSDALFDALLSHSPGTYGGFDIDDCVIIGFEDDKYNVAFIFGKLYVDIPESSSACGLFDTLKVTNSVELPSDTRIGDYTIGDVINLYNGVMNGGNRSINPDVLKKYVQWTNTEREVEGELVDVYANKIRVMTGEEFDSYKESEDFDEDEFNETLYFLSSLPSTDEIIDTGS